LTSEVLCNPGPWQEGEQQRMVRAQVSAIERGEDDVAFSPAVDAYTEELRLGAWLHEREALSGSTTAMQRRNLEARYDDELVRTLAAARYHANSGFAGLPIRAMVGALGETAALVDLFLGRVDGADACHATVLTTNGFYRQYATRLKSESSPIPDPEDPHALLLLDAVAPLVASVRLRVREDPGLRVVSRGGREALAAAAHDVLGRLHEDLAELRETCSHLVICPHGPLAFLPFHLLPVSGISLADDWAVTTIPSVGALAGREPSPRETEIDVERGIVVSPAGGLPHGLAEEPRLIDHRIDLENLSPPGTAIPTGQATPTAALDLLQHSKYAHIAAHGSALGNSPAFHCLYLDQDPDQDSDGRLLALDVARRDLRGLPSLSTSGETLIIEESVNLEGENGDCWDVGDEHEWSQGCG